MTLKAQTWCAGGYGQWLHPWNNWPCGGWTGDEGHISAFVVTVLAAILALAGLTLDGGLALADKIRANGQAEAAARAGAQALDLGAYRTTGAVRVVPSQAALLARRYLNTVGQPAGTISGGAAPTIDDSGQSATQADMPASTPPSDRTSATKTAPGVGVGEPWVTHLPAAPSRLPAQPGGRRHENHRPHGPGMPMDLRAVHIQAAAGDQAVELVIDSARGIIGYRTQTLPPGIRQTYTVAFGVPAGHADFRVQVEPGWFRL